MTAAAIEVAGAGERIWTRRRSGGPGLWREAVAAGARAVFALPLQAGAMLLGVLSLQARAMLLGVLSLYRALPAGELADVLVFADIALHCRTRRRVISGSPGYRLPLEGLIGPSRGGASGDRDGPGGLGVSLEEALARLAHAFTSGVALGDIAGDVADGRLRFDPAVAARA